MNHYQALYISHAQHPMNEQELIDLLQQARAHNEKEGITGVLLYVNKIFVQLLEGEQKKVEALIEKIKKDPRHEGMVMLTQGPSAFPRICPEWKMGFAHPDWMKVPNVKGLLKNDNPELLVYLARNNTSMAAVFLREIIFSNPTYYEFCGTEICTHLED